MDERWFGDGRARAMAAKKPRREILICILEIFQNALGLLEAGN
jgi:hypothetical protein